MSDVFDKHEYVIGKVHGDNFDGICLDYNGDIQATIVDLVAEVWALQTRVAELETQVKRWEELFVVTEEAAEDCRTGVPLLTHEQVFGVAPVPSATDALPKEET